MISTFPASATLQRNWEEYTDYSIHHLALPTSASLYELNRIFDGSNNVARVRADNNTFTVSAGGKLVINTQADSFMASASSGTKRIKQILEADKEAFNIYTSDTSSTFHNYGGSKAFGVSGSKVAIFHKQNKELTTPIHSGIGGKRIETQDFGVNFFGAQTSSQAWFNFAASSNIWNMFFNSQILDMYWRATGDTARQYLAMTTNYEKVNEETHNYIELYKDSDNSYIGLYHKGEKTLKTRSGGITLLNYLDTESQLFIGRDIAVKDDLVVSSTYSIILSGGYYTNIFFDDQRTSGKYGQYMSMYFPDDVYNNIYGHRIDILGESAGDFSSVWGQYLYVNTLGSLSGYLRGSYIYVGNTQIVGNGLQGIQLNVNVGQDVGGDSYGIWSNFTGSDYEIDGDVYGILNSVSCAFVDVTGDLYGTKIDIGPDWNSIAGSTYGLYVKGINLGSTNNYGIYIDNTYLPNYGLYSTSNVNNIIEGNLEIQGAIDTFVIKQAKWIPFEPAKSTFINSTRSVHLSSGDPTYLGGGIVDFYIHQQYSGFKVNSDSQNMWLDTSADKFFIRSYIDGLDAKKMLPTALGGQYVTMITMNKNNDVYLHYKGASTLKTIKDGIQLVGGFSGAPTAELFIGREVEAANKNDLVISSTNNLHLSASHADNEGILSPNHWAIGNIATVDGGYAPGSMVVFSINETSDATNNLTGLGISISNTTAATNAFTYGTRITAEPGATTFKWVEGAQMAGQCSTIGASGDLILGAAIDGNGTGDYIQITDVIGLRARATTGFGMVDAQFTNMIAGEFGILKYGTGNFDIENAYGVLVRNPENGSSTGVLTNAYGLYIEDFSSANGFRNKWNFYSEGATAKNYFEGAVSAGNVTVIGDLKVLGSIDLPSNYTGQEILVSGATSAAIAFGSSLPDEAYTITAELVNTVDNPPSIYNHVIIKKNIDGFRILFSGNLDSDNYSLDWSAIR